MQTFFNYNTSLYKDNHPFQHYLQYMQLNFISVNILYGGLSIVHVFTLINMENES